MPASVSPESGRKWTSPAAREKTMTQLNKSGHLAWCGLIALALARQDGGVRSAAQANLFSPAGWPRP
jgi:hypothetical protein